MRSFTKRLNYFYESMTEYSIPPIILLECLYVYIYANIHLSAGVTLLTSDA